MMIKSERDRKRLIERVRSGEPLLRWIDKDSHYAAEYGDLTFFIGNLRPRIFMFYKQMYARTQDGKIILKRRIDPHETVQWMRKADELLFNILMGRIKLGKPVQSSGLGTRTDPDIYDQLFE